MCGVAAVSPQTCRVFRVNAVNFGEIPREHNSNESVGAEDVVLDIEHVTLMWLEKEKNVVCVFFFSSSFQEFKERLG